MSTGTLTAELDRDYAAFQHLVATAERQFRAGRPAAAAATAQIAAHVAWLNPCGIFASAEIERLLVQVASMLPVGASRKTPTPEPVSVLHVATQAYQTGGSTQFIASWVDQDLDRHHTVCLTGQRGAPAPVKLTSRASERLRLIRLDREPGLLARAVTLRRLATKADIVLVHTHPSDVVPVLAFGGEVGATLPPVVYVDQADHVFWVGTAIAQTLLSMRSSGAELATACRGIDPTRVVTAMRPLQFRDRQIDREGAKRSLGVDPADVLVVTAADASKYRPTRLPSLLEMILPVFGPGAGARLLAAGPAAEGEWAAAEARTEGRVRALGQLPDVSVLHQAADVYLDSFPFASLTSLLESGSLGNPVVTYRGHPDECAVLGADTAGIDDLMERPRTPDDLRITLAQLIDDATLRVSRGAVLEEAIRRRHQGEGWLTEMRRVYAHAATSAPVVGMSAIERRTGTLEQMVRLVVTRSSHSTGVAGAVRANLGYLPLGERISAARALIRAGLRPRPADLLSDRAASSLRLLRETWSRDRRPGRSTRGRS